jgi:hypothetical protein
MSFIEGIIEGAEAISKAMLSPLEKLDPVSCDTCWDDNNVFKLTASVLEACGSIPVRIFKTTGEVLDKMTGDGLANDITMISYTLGALPSGYVVVLPCWFAAAALRGIGEKIDD